MIENCSLSTICPHMDSDDKATYTAPIIQHYHQCRRPNCNNHVIHKDCGFCTRHCICNVPGLADTLIDDFDEEVDSVSGVVLDGKPARPLYALLTHDGVTDTLIDD